MSPKSLLRQSGAALVIALVFLIALTLLGLAAIGGNTLQQKMAYSFSESNRAFQGAESALASGEAWLEAQADKPIPECGVAGLGCPTVTAVWPTHPVPTTSPRGTSVLKDQPNYADTQWWVDYGRLFGYSYVTGAAPAQLNGQSYSIGGTSVVTSSQKYPRYVIEELGKDINDSRTLGGASAYTLWYYQVTARGTGVLGESATTVQSVYTKGF